MNRSPIRNRRMQRLCIENLESRWMLDADPVIWGTDARLTLSFAPDGTHVADATSELHARLNGLASPQVWQSTIVQAFQTWAQFTNGDIGVVADDGSEFGAPGVRRDSRFGDIRIGAVPLDDQLYAVAIPTTQIVDGTWVGDVLFNSHYDFTDIDELFAVALHEAGHVFGMPHSDDPLSPMFTHGIPQPGSRTPTVDDVAAIQAIFGPRAEDVYDAQNEPGAVDIPAFQLADSPLGSAPSVVFGDLTSTDDVDVYRVEIPSSYNFPGASLTFHLVATGISSLAARMDILPSSGGQPFASATSTWRSNASIDVEFVAPGENYYVQISSDPGNFEIGGYTLIVTYNQVNQVSLNSITDLVHYPIRQLDVGQLRTYFTNGFQLLANLDEGGDDLEGEEHELPTTAGFAENTHYQIDASIEAMDDIDRYLIQSPHAAPISGEWARVELRSLEQTEFLLNVRVFDSERDLLPVEYLIRNDQTMVVQFGPAQFNSEYFLEVSAAPDSPSSTGNYRLEASFGVTQIERSLFVSDSLSTMSSLQRYELSVHRPQLFHFQLDATENAGVDANLIMTIRDGRNHIVTTLSVALGEVRTKALFLPAGEFRIIIRTDTPGGTSGPISFHLMGSTIDDPLGPRIDDPTTDAFEFDVDRRLLFASIFFGV